MNRFGITWRFSVALLAVAGLSLAGMALLGLGALVPLTLNALLLALLLIDHLRAPGPAHFRAQRMLPDSFEQRRQAAIVLQITADLQKPVHLRVLDAPPGGFAAERRPTEHLWSGEPVLHRYAVLPRHRGVFSFERCHIEVRGPLGFAVRRFALDCADAAQVYPDLEPMRHYRMLAARNQLSREDAALHRLRGVGSEFAGIREYFPGDDRRKVNWKASARAGKLMTNLYDVEKNREVVIAVDTGRWMQGSMGEVSRLDRALELAAAVMQVAISSGDRVGLALYGTGLQAYLPPGKGAAHMRRFLQLLYTAQGDGSQPSLAALSAALRRRLSKRAFVCVLTYLDGPQEALQAAEDLLPLSRRHAVYLGSLTDTGLEQLINKKAAAGEDIYLKAAAAHRKTAGLGAVDVLRRNGIGACAAEPGELLTRTVRHYLSVKRLPQ